MWEYVNYFYGIPSKGFNFNYPIHTYFLAQPDTKLLLYFRNPPKGEWTSSNSGFMNSMNGFFKSKHGNSLELNISAFISPEMAAGAGAVLLSPQEYKKKLLDFSSGVVSHVKSYYNASLFPSSASSKPSQQPTVPQPSDPLSSEAAPSAKSNDYSDVVVMANNNNEEAADKKIEFEPEKEQKIPETSGTMADST